MRDRLETTKIAVCNHGADNSLRIVTDRFENKFTVKVTESICSRCLEEMRFAFHRGDT